MAEISGQKLSPLRAGQRKSQQIPLNPNKIRQSAMPCGSAPGPLKVNKANRPCVLIHENMVGMQPAMNQAG